MTLRGFVNYVRDAASRFLVSVERSKSKHPGLYPDRQSFPLWMGAFVAFMRAERAGPSSTDATKVKPRGPRST